MTKTEQAVLEALEARAGRASVGDLMEATGRSRSGVKLALKGLAIKGVIDRLEGGQYRGDVSQYRVAAMPEAVLSEGVRNGSRKGSNKGSKVTPSSLPQGRGSNGSNAGVAVSQGRGQKGVSQEGVTFADSRACGVILDLEVQVQTPLPPRGPLPLLPAETSAFDELLQRQLPITAAGTAQTLLADLIDDARANDVVMTSRVIGMFAKYIKEELSGKATPEQVKAGLALMFARGKVIPSMLSTFVMEASMPKPRPVANPAAMRYGRGMTPAMILDTAPGARELWEAERAKDRAENAARQAAQA